MNIKQNKIVRTLGSLKFAVVIILIFACAMAVGTFQESYHGTEYANRLIYKSWFFMLIQLGIFSSVLCAAILRLPFQKRLYGFYTIHLGILVIGLGSLVTHLWGIDGVIQLDPKTPTQKVFLSQDVLYMRSAGQRLSFPLPSKPFETKLNANLGPAKLKIYLPFADPKIVWKDSSYPSSQYKLANQFVSENFIVSAHPESSYPSRFPMGPLTIHYFSPQAIPCLEKIYENRLMVLNKENGTCKPISSYKVERGFSRQGHEQIEIFVKEKFKFFPLLSSYPVKDSLESIVNSPLEIYNRLLFENGKNLLLFGEKYGFYEDKKLKIFDINLNSPKQLPWMGSLTLELLEHHAHSFPTLEVEPTIPIQDNSKLISGNLKAVQIEVDGKDYWIKNDAQTTIKVGNESFAFSLETSEIKLPFSLTLDRFHMNMNPGTQDPASYESYVKASYAPNEEIKIYMNNPLKTQSLTFYQSSYYPSGDEYGSVLSVNFDPGRAIKYLGSILLIFGAIWHYYILRERKVVHA